MIQQLLRWGREFWVFAAVLLLLALAFGISDPAWAAPPAADNYQTVPKPTPTAGTGPVATATPRPDDDDEDGDGGSGAAPAPQDRDVPAFIILGEAAAPASGLTATITVATLNVREGPGVEYAVVGTLFAGDVVNVLFRNEANTWYYICCVPETGGGGWASAQLLSLGFDRAASADLIPVTVAGEGVEASAASVASETETAATDETIAAADNLPIELRVRMNPPFLAQGQTGQLVLRVSNPNLEEALNVEVTDELTAELELVEAVASGGGAVTQEVSVAGLPIVLAKWDAIPAGGDVRLVLTVRVAEGLSDGAVFDNMAAAVGSNTGYATGSVTIGMPPVALPDFQ